MDTTILESCRGCGGRGFHTLRQGNEEIPCADCAGRGRLRPHVTRHEAAEILGVSLRTLDRLLAAGKLPYTKLPSGEGQPKAVRIHRAELALLLKGTRR
jgi:excisionase family DNA binding protein